MLHFGFSLSHQEVRSRQIDVGRVQNEVIEDGFGSVAHGVRSLDQKAAWRLRFCAPKCQYVKRIITEAGFRGIVSKAKATPRSLHALSRHLKLGGSLGWKRCRCCQVMVKAASAGTLSSSRRHSKSSDSSFPLRVHLRRSNLDSSERLAGSARFAVAQTSHRD